MNPHDPGPPDTGMRASQGEDWLVPTDHGPVPFEDWWNETGYRLPPGRLASDVPAAAWAAARQRYCATLRRVGWLDQKGRVWLRVPQSDGFDGGSLTPLLIDVREDSP